MNHHSSHHGDTLNHVPILWHSGTLGTESTLIILCNVGIKASDIVKAEMLESWVEMGTQSFYYLRNHSMDYWTGKRFKEVKVIPDPDFSR